MVGQVIDQAPVTQLTQQARSPKPDQGEGAGFDALLQQKRQTGDEQVRQRQDAEPAGRKDESPKAQAREDDVETEKPAAAQEDEIPDDAKAVLAAMMIQPQPQPVTDAAPAQTEEAAVAPEAAVAVEAPVQTAAEEAPVQAQTAEQPAQAAQEAPAQAGTVREAPREDAEQPREEPVQTAGTEQQVSQTEQAQPRDSRQPQDQTGSEERPETNAAQSSAPRRAETDADDGQAPVEAPLFEQAAVADTVPVKVAEAAPVLNPERPLPIESDQAGEQLAEIVTTGVQDGREVSVIRIDPENLGPVQLTVSRDAEGVVHLALEAADPKTRTLLEKHASNVQNIMADNLHEDVRVEVRQNERSEQQDWTDGRNGRQQQEQRQQQKAREDDSHDFMQRLRLGLVGQDGDET